MDIYILIKGNVYTCVYLCICLYVFGNRESKKRFDEMGKKEELNIYLYMCICICI